ncbi:MAG TPA: hypothetical protein P5228_01045 [Bacteroidales bacterium]|nr:hypothetical protein [Bacteroidales bacterium]HRZ49299.1 hypothetical protein [Bacteroidales bacterium]
MVQSRLIWILLLLPAGIFPAGAGPLQPDTPFYQGLQPIRMIKFSPFALMEVPQPSLQIAFEYGIAPSLSLQHEAGLLVPVNFFLSSLDNGRSFPGFKFKTEVRKYLLQPNQPVLYPLQYFALEGMIKYRKTRTEYWDSNLSDPYFRLMTVDHERSQMAFHVKYGRVVKLGRQDKAYADWYAGIGLRHYAHDYRLVPDGIPVDKQSVPEPWTIIAPSLALGLKICLQL